MILNEPNTSSYYISNMNYSKNLELLFEKVRIDLTGFCNSFGYEMTAKFEKVKPIYIYKFQKNL